MGQRFFPATSLRLVLAGGATVLLDRGSKGRIRDLAHHLKQILIKPVFENEKNSSQIFIDEALPLPTPFHHIAVTFNQGTITYFFDGQKLNSRTVPGSLLFDAVSDLRLGIRDDGANNDFMDGVVEEVRISQGIRYSATFDPTLFGPFDPANDASEQ